MIHQGEFLFCLDEFENAPSLSWTQIFVFLNSFWGVSFYSCKTVKIGLIYDNYYEFGRIDKKKGKKELV